VESTNSASALEWAAAANEDTSESGQTEEEDLGDATDRAELARASEDLSGLSASSEIDSSSEGEVIQFAVPPPSRPQATTSRRRRREPSEDPEEEQSSSIPRPPAKRIRQDPNMHGSHASLSSNANGTSTNGAVANGSGTPRGKSRAGGSNGLANGHSSAHANGALSRHYQQYHGHNRQEVVRLLMQTMQDLGLSTAAKALEDESGVELESPSVAALRASVENGEWEEAEQLLLGPESPGNARHRSHQGQTDGLILKSEADARELRFMIREQKYLELLEQRDHGRALMVLRTELTPLNRDTNHLHFLSGLVVSPTVEDLKEQANWSGAYGGSRQQLLQTLSEHIHHSVMIPPSRLSNLLDQVRKGWVRKCIWHNPVEPLSLFVDHICDREQFPLHTVKVLDQREEIWYLEFSHNGRHLATAGADKTVIVYNVANDWEERFRLTGHSRSVVYVTWSPDDKWLVTCSKDKSAKLWNAITGDCVTTIHKHAEPVTTAAWLPGSTGFVTGSLDPSNSLNKWLISDLQQKKNTQPSHTFPTDFRVQDIAITPNGEHLAAISADSIQSRLVLYNLYTNTMEYSVTFKTALTCVRVSRDGQHLLLNLADNELQCLDIYTREIVQRYTGQQQGVWVIRSTWAGADENLILSGSQDGKVYVFHRESGALIETLEGHAPLDTGPDGSKSGGVNAIAWNEAEPCMFASAGDDKTVRIWSNENYTPATTRRTSSEASLLYASHSSLPGIDASQSNRAAVQGNLRLEHGPTSAVPSLL